MKKNLYLLIALCFSLSFLSCSDDKEDSQANILGNWQYTSPHFAFEYAQDSISLVMNQGMKKSIAVADLKTMFLDMANEKMGDYFKGVQFFKENRLTIRMQMSDQKEQTLSAGWKQSDDYIQVTLDSTELKKMTNGAISQVPTISFNYQLTDNQLKMYFNKDYLIIVYTMMEDTILDQMILPAMGIDPATAPEKMKDAVKTQIKGILEQIIRLEIGFNLEHMYTE